MLVEVVEFEQSYLAHRSVLLSLENDLRQHVVYEIQAWWATHNLRRKLQKQEEKMHHSHFYYRIRRLVKMKYDIDHWDKWKTTISSLENIYCDLLPELAEYRLYKSKKIQQIVTKFLDKILAKYKSHQGYYILLKVTNSHLMT